MPIIWLLKKFDDLTPLQVYQILQLRNEVFVVEQQCVFQDADGKDPYCYHIMGIQDNKLIAYTRIAPPGICYKEASIGRVVTAMAERRTGAGKELMQQSITTLYNLFGKVPIKIGAQFRLQKFYESFGFLQTSDVYLEDGIEHIYMLKTVSSSNE